MSENQELLPPDAPRWAVITCHKRQTKHEIAIKYPKEISHHELIFGNQVQTKRTGETGLEALREMASFLNRKGMVPRPAVECLADANGSLEARLHKQTIRAQKIEDKAWKNAVTPIGTP